MAGTTTNDDSPAGRWRALALVGTAELLAMSLWFSASAVAPELTATWNLSPGEAGLLTSAVQVGFVAGALGSALPHLLRVLGGVGQPRAVLFGASALALVGGALVLLVRPGPYQAPAAPFDPGAVRRIVRDRPTSLANLGYFGHIWELPAYLLATRAIGGADGLASLLTFGTALTLQTAIGFLLTTVSIQLTPVVADAVGWRWAFAPLALGPVVGYVAMGRLRAHPAAARLAGGRG